MHRGGGHLHVPSEFGVVEQVTDAKHRGLHERLEILQIAHHLQVAQIPLEPGGDITLEPQ